MTRVMSGTGTIALFALILGTACSSNEESTGPRGQGNGSGASAGSGSGGQNTGGAGGQLGSGGSFGGFGGTGAEAGSSGVGGGGGDSGSSGVGGTGGDTGGMGGDAGGGTGGMGGDAGGGTGGMGGDAGTAGQAGTAGMGGSSGGGTCCASGNCICRDPVPTSLTGARGPYTTKMYDLAGAGCIYYPDDPDAKPPFSAVAVSDGFLGAGGCTGAQTGGWGPLLASYGIVTMIIHTTGSDQPAVRATKLLAGIAAYKTENTKSGSPLFGKLAGRYGTSGFSMGGGGTTRATVQDKTLLSSVAIMPYSPQGTGVVTPTLVICGSSDGVAPCASHGTPVYGAIPAATPKMRVQISSGHAGQPSSGGNMSGAWGLAFTKLYLDGDERWKKVLLSGDNEQTNIMP